MNICPRLPLLRLAALTFLMGGLQSTAGPTWDAPPGDRVEGQFWRLHWYERTGPDRPPAPSRRLRINAPETSLHPNFGHRPEARDNGLMLITSAEDLLQVTAAELYVEMWGGHPGTTDARFSVNGRSTYALPEVGTAAGHCTYFHPSTPLRLTDLVNGTNAFQFAVDRGTTFWGHAMIDEGCLRVALPQDHPDLVAAGLEGFEAQVVVSAAESTPEAFRLELAGPPDPRIARVVFQGYYFGYDENGNRRLTDWHGFTRNRVPGAMLGAVTEPPFVVEWKTAMLPAQKDVAVRALVFFEEPSECVYMTPSTGGLAIAERPAGFFELIHAHDLPDHFWSRAGKLKSCHLYLGVDPAQIETAELHVVAWTGGAGTVTDYFTLNGHPLPVAEGAAHRPVYTRTPIPPAFLRRGLNRLELLSDTVHHGIEICLPGPALAIRVRE